MTQFHVKLPEDVAVFPMLHDLKRTKYCIFDINTNDYKSQPTLIWRPYRWSQYFHITEYFLNSANDFLNCFLTYFANCCSINLSFLLLLLLSVLLLLILLILLLVLLILVLLVLLLVLCLVLLQILLLLLLLRFLLLL